MSWESSDTRVPRTTIRVDLVRVDRIARVIGDDAGAAKLLTSGERAYCGSRRHARMHAAVRFAAKEAVLKALGTGLSRVIRWRDVEIVGGGRCFPRVCCMAPLPSWLARGLAALDVSLPHTDSTRSRRRSQRGHDRLEVDR